MEATYISNNQFSVFGDRTLEFVPNRRLKINLAGDGIIYDSVNTSSYSVPDTIVTTTESGLTANLTDVLYGIVEPGISGSLPNHNHDGSEGSGGFVTNTDLITSDLNLYISVSGSDTTGDGSIENPYATFTGPTTYLKGKQINPNINVSIRYLDGVHTLNSLLINTAYLPYHDRLFVYGTTVLDRSVTSVQSSSGSTGAYSVIYNMSTVSGIEVGNYALINNDATGGTNPTYACGVHQITNVDTPNNRITILSKHRKGAPAGAVTASVKIFKTIINQYSTSTGVNSQYGKHLRLGGFVLVGGSSGVGIQAVDGGSIVVASASFPVGVVGFSNSAIAARCGYSSLASSGFSGAGSNSIYVQETATFRGTSIVVSGAGSAGVLCQYASQFQGNDVVSTGNVSHGFYAVYQSYIHSGPSDSTGNGGWGWTSNYNSIIRRTGTCIDTNNTSGTTSATNGSYVQTA